MFIKHCSIFLLFLYQGLSSSGPRSILMRNQTKGKFCFCPSIYSPSSPASEPDKFPFSEASAFHFKIPDKTQGKQLSLNFRKRMNQVLVHSASYFYLLLDNVNTVVHVHSKTCQSWNQCFWLRLYVPEIGSLPMPGQSENSLCNSRFSVGGKALLFVSQSWETSSDQGQQSVP